MVWQWQQLDHMKITCTVLHQTDNHISTTSLTFTSWVLFLVPKQQCQSTEGYLYTLQCTTSQITKQCRFWLFSRLMLTFLNVYLVYHRQCFLTSVWHCDVCRQMQMEDAEQRRASRFRAQPASVLQELPFEPQHSKRSPTSLYRQLCFILVELL